MATREKSVTKVTQIIGSGGVVSESVPLSPYIEAEVYRGGRVQPGEITLYTDADHPGNDSTSRPQIRIAFAEDGRTPIGISVVGEFGIHIMDWNR